METAVVWSGKSWTALLFSINFALLPFLTVSVDINFLQSTASCPVCGSEGLYYMGDQQCHWGVSHVMWWPRLLPKQCLARHLCRVYAYLHLRGRKHSHDAADCQVTPHTHTKTSKTTNLGQVHSLPSKSAYNNTDMQLHSTFTVPQRQGTHHSLLLPHTQQN